MAVDYATGWPVAKAVAKLWRTESQSSYSMKFTCIRHICARLVRFTRVPINPYHPWTNGKVERLNGILEDMISKLLFGKSTKLYLDQALFACKIRTHSTTKTSPFYLLYGRQPHLLGDPNKALPLNVNPANHEEPDNVLGETGGGTGNVRASCQGEEHSERDSNAPCAARRGLGTCSSSKAPKI